MIRIPNPGSNIDIFLRIFKALHHALSEKSEFNLDDMTEVLIDYNLATSQGAIGKEALKRSTREDRSRDPLYNQSKMYAELLRALGWMSSKSSALSFEFSPFSSFVAESQDIKSIIEECLLGLAFPSEVLAVKGAQEVRPFYTILRTMVILDGALSRDEMILGPLTLSNDRNPKEIDQMINQLKLARKSKAHLKSMFSQLQSERNITKTTMENYTRFPMASLQWTGWANGKLGRLFITVKGRDLTTKLQTFNDIRLKDFRSHQKQAQQAIIRVSFHQMMRRSNIDDGLDQDAFQADCELLKKNGILAEREVWFNPFQQLPLKEVLNSLFYLKNKSKNTILKGNDGKSASTTVDSKGKYFEPEQRKFECAHVEYQFSEQNSSMEKDTESLQSYFKGEQTKKKGNINQVINEFIQMHQNDNKDIFYPLVVKLLKIIGFNCHLSRQGTNYSRNDAIIIDPNHSIPIEIKSPGEETEISVKAVRQALENKIILLARHNYPCTFEDITLVVGFNSPAQRSEVHELIEDIFKTYKIKVGIIDFKSLCTLAIEALLSNRKITLKEFNERKGVLKFERKETD